MNRNLNHYRAQALMSERIISVEKPPQPVHSSIDLVCDDFTTSVPANLVGLFTGRVVLADGTIRHTIEYLGYGRVLISSFAFAKYVREEQHEKFRPYGVSNILLEEETGTPHVPCLEG
jgi:hypothetical protein